MIGIRSDSYQSLCYEHYYTASTQYDHGTLVRKYHPRQDYMIVISPNIRILRITNGGIDFSKPAAGVHSRIRSHELDSSLGARVAYALYSVTRIRIQGQDVE